MVNYVRTWSHMHRAYTHSLTQSVLCMQKIGLSNENLWDVESQGHFQAVARQGAKGNGCKEFCSVVFPKYLR